MFTLLTKESRRTWLIAACMLGTSPLGAYEVIDNWCGKSELRVNIDFDSFTSRGLPATPVDQHHRTAMTWWVDAQATLNMRFNTTTDDHSSRPKGPVYALCEDEDSKLATASGYTHLKYGWHPSCHFFGNNIDEFRVVIESNEGNRDCGDGDGWGFDIGDVRSSRKPLFMIMAHEYGHVFGLDHADDDLYSLMYESVGSSGRLSSDDAAGMRKGLGEGTSHKKLRTVRATPATDGTLAFDEVQKLSEKGIYMPQIAGNGFFQFEPVMTDFDYALAWVDKKNRINVALANDDSDGELDLGVSHTTEETTQNRFGLTVGWNNSIGVAWVSDDADRNINFMVSYNYGADWIRSEFPGHHAHGGVSLSYDWNQHRWVMSWVHPSGPQNGSFRIATMVSDNFLGQSWTSIASSYGDSLTMPNKAPARTCARRDRNACLMIYRSFATPNIREIYQQAFELQTEGRNRLQTLMTDARSSDYAYSDLDLVRMDGSSTATRGYVLSYVWPTTANDALTYRIKYDAATDETEAFERPRQKWSGGKSRTGYALGYNYRTERVRVVWKEN